MIARDQIEAEILRQTLTRGGDKSVCPSEVARALATDEAGWRSLLGAVRSAAIRLAQAGKIDVLRKGKPVDPGAEIRGVIRLRIHPSAKED
ncbi:DUF3253 domain-containing protein [Roseomonas sp. AR75]|uniref:DUF3253 domain-containing protein n=1 Tax=Roseomonas sp. AR75 TaxID=2562311 RepID=UPI0010BFFB57|nr:DUF3253 domain-containing protein [Roseomonas sp. AR75]